MGTTEKFKNKIYKIVGRLVVKRAAKKVKNKLTEKKDVATKKVLKKSSKSKLIK